MGRNDVRKAYELMKRFRKVPGTRLKVIKNMHGNTLAETMDILSRWKEYCEDMYKNDGTGNEDGHACR